MLFTQFQNLILYMLIGMFILGITTFSIGVIILVVGAWGRELNATLTQTNRLAQKGLADEISGLVGNASSLLSSINDLIRTRNGIGITLILMGGLLMALPCWIVLSQMNRLP
jgi:hypothetical protein